MKKSWVKTIFMSWSHYAKWTIFNMAQAKNYIFRRESNKEIYNENFFFVAIFKNRINITFQQKEKPIHVFTLYHYTNLYRWHHSWWPNNNTHLVMQMHQKWTLNTYTGCTIDVTSVFVNSTHTDVLSTVIMEFCWDTLEHVTGS